MHPYAATGCNDPKTIRERIQSLYALMAWSLSMFNRDGSIVACEFDLPAVLGTGKASWHICHGKPITGKPITVDGTQGLAVREPGN